MDLLNSWADCPGEWISLFVLFLVRGGENGFRKVVVMILDPAKEENSQYLGLSIAMSSCLIYSLLHEVPVRESQNRCFRCCCYCGCY
jgi:hypothetical protein